MLPVSVSLLSLLGCQEDMRELSQEEDGSDIHWWHPRVWDADGDGYSVRLGDCDDRDKSIHPAAYDVPWDGLD